MRRQQETKETDYKKCEETEVIPWRGKILESDSEAAGWIRNLNTENFVTVSFYLANSLYGIIP